MTLEQYYEELNALKLRFTGTTYGAIYEYVRNDGVIVPITSTALQTPNGRICSLISIKRYLAKRDEEFDGLKNGW
ncbi:hypothetical protein RYZ26_13050 [Terasakiella sp. A23]|uniref:hypothetical protein n=1 Tax=Terasakiella sp. FCG-A23 TaxID=3080561 RepID=UPI002952A8C2|nr:hypothetical protein [Terasakiella sp. A23]MDV7340526.1 hypothetical protein [Terasakiella sp. A23]